MKDIFNASLKNQLAEQGLVDLEKKELLLQRLQFCKEIFEEIKLKESFSPHCPEYVKFTQESSRIEELASKNNRGKILVDLLKDVEILIKKLDKYNSEPEDNAIAEAIFGKKIIKIL
jgi:hypothetical protein